MYNEQIIRFVGLFVSVVGLAVTAPDAVVLTVHSLMGRLREAARRLFRRNHVIHASTVGAVARVTASAIGYGYKGYPAKADVEQRIEWLHTRIEAQETQMQALANRVGEVDARHGHARLELQQLLTDQIGALRDSIIRSEKAQIGVDGAGLIVAALGIVLSGLSSELSRTPWFTWSAVLVAVGAITVRASYGSYRSWKARR